MITLQRTIKKFTTMTDEEEKNFAKEYIDTYHPTLADMQDDMLVQYRRISGYLKTRFEDNPDITLADNFDELVRDIRMYVIWELC